MAVGIAPKLIEHLQNALACAVHALSYNPPGRAFIAPGALVAFDDCCAGQVWVRVDSMTPVTSLQARKASGEFCGPDYWDVTVELGVVRCAHTLDDEGNAPTPEELTADSLVEVVDAAALLEAIECCIKPSSINTWTPLGPDGGCVGSQYTYTVRIPGCDCPVVPV